MTTSISSDDSNLDSLILNDGEKKSKVTNRVKVLLAAATVVGLGAVLLIVAAATGVFGRPSPAQTTPPPTPTPTATARPTTAKPTHWKTKAPTTAKPSTSAPTGIPKFINHAHTEVGKVSRISRFRSGFGHDFSTQPDACCSMKHYFEFGDHDWSQVRMFVPTAGTVFRYEAEQLPNSGAQKSDLYLIESWWIQY